jgi:exportin-1
MAPAGTSNREFLQNFVGNLLVNAFPNLTPAQIQKFITDLFSQADDINRFKLTLRDFLIQLKEFAGDNAELFIEDREKAAQEAKTQERERAMKVGGLLKPSEIDDDELWLDQELGTRTAYDPGDLVVSAEARPNVVGDDGLDGWQAYGL